MAAPKTLATMGCLKRILITIIVLVVLIAAAVLICGNLTMEQLGIADKEFGGTTLREMGLADVKIFDVIKVIRALAKPDEGKIVTNAPNDEDKAEANVKSRDLGLAKRVDGTVKYASLIDTQVVTEEKLVITYSDKNIAAMMNAMIEEGIEESEDAQALKDMGASIAQIIIKDGKVEVLLKIKSEGLAEGSGIPAFIVPDALYINSVNSLEVAADGTLTAKSNSIVVNGLDDEIGNKLMATIVSKAVPAEEGSVDTGVDVINQKAGSLFCSIMNNIGLVGTATIKSGTANVAENIVYGAAGLGTNRITLITRTAASEE